MRSQDRSVRGPVPLAVQPLAREAFAPFGEVIEATDAAHRYPVNAGSSVRYHALATIEPGPQGRAIVSIFRASPRPLPVVVEALERHPLASQAFVPLSGRPYLVVVARAGQAPSAADLVAFLARGDQGVNYAPGVWHHPLLALEATSDFVVVDRDGPGENCEELALARAALIDLPQDGAR